MSELVVIEDSTVLMMARDARYTNAIPCLANKGDVFKPISGGCGACARKRQQKQRQAMATVKSCLAALSPEKKLELKQLLGAKKVRVVYSRAGGEIVQLTF